MPADGEIRFTELLAELIKSEYQKARNSQCIRSAVANGFMVSCATYLAAYIGTHNPRKSFYVFGLPAFVVSTIATAAYCDIRTKGGT